MKNQRFFNRQICADAQIRGLLAAWGIKMSLSPDMIELLEQFDKYKVFYPDEDEPGFDGVHYGGFKCLSDDAPESARKAYDEYEKIMEDARKSGRKL